MSKMGKEKNGGVYRKRNNKTQQQKGESPMKMKAIYCVALMANAPLRNRMRGL
jgi:hypothetical protein